MVKALNRASEIQVVYRPEFRATERPQITSALDAYEIFIEHWNRKRIEYNEEFKIILLNMENGVLGIATISVGGVSGTVFDPKIIFAIALKCNASALILAHNHPSGNLKASNADLTMKKKLVEIGKLMELLVLDHLIISNDGFYSLADDGMM